MDSVSVDEYGDEVIRVRCRSYVSWLSTLLLPAVVAVMFLKGLTSSGTVSGVVWWVAMAVLIVSGVATEIRAARGLTLDADGVTWHRIELFVPWSQVTGLDVDSGVKGSEKLRLIVRTTDPRESLRGHRDIARFMIMGNIKTFGGPIAIPVHQLTGSPESLIAAADRLKGSAAPSTPGLEGRRARRDRAHLMARVWGYASGTALSAMLVATLIF